MGNANDKPRRSTPSGPPVVRSASNPVYPILNRSETLEEIRERLRLARSTSGDNNSMDTGIRLGIGRGRGRIPPPTTSRPAPPPPRDDWVHLPPPIRPTVTSTTRSQPARVEPLFRNPPPPIGGSNNSITSSNNLKGHGSISSYNNPTAKKQNDDCPLYFSPQGCTKIDNCEYRHSEAARYSLEECQDWKNGLCTLWSLCDKRHTSQDVIVRAPPPPRIVPSSRPSISTTATTSTNSQQARQTPFEAPRPPRPFTFNLPRNILQAEAGSSRATANSATPATTSNSAQATNNGGKHGGARKYNDCKYFYTRGCRKRHCEFRHCSAALGSNVECPQWKKYNCLNEFCTMRHARLDSEGDVPVDLNVNNSAQGSQALNDCHHFIYKDCKRSNCRFRHSAGAKMLYEAGNDDICPRWRSRSNCGNCNLLHHDPQKIDRTKFPARVRRERVLSSTSTSSEGGVNAKGVKKGGDKASESKGGDKSENECKICFRDYSEIREGGERLCTIDCGHAMCEPCAKSIIRSDRLCPFCRKRIVQEPRPLFI